MGKWYPSKSFTEKLGADFIKVDYTSVLEYLKHLKRKHSYHISGKS